MQLAWGMLEAFFLGGCLFGLLRLRSRLGIFPLLIAIGVLQYLQVVLAIGLYVEILPGLTVSPGSAVIFPATLLGVLLVYVVEGTHQARQFAYGLFLANALLSTLTLLLGGHLSAPDVVRPVILPDALLWQNPRVLLVGTIALLIDALVVVAVYEALKAIRWVFLRVWISLSIALALDSVLFSVGAFVEDPRFVSILGAGMVGKLIFAAPYAAALAIGRRLLPDQAPDGAAGAVMELRTYRERYLAAQSEALRDALTGLRNRRALDGDLARIDRRSTYALLLIDIDHFKQINDQFGHLAGDEVLKLVAHTLDRSLRAQDVAYRYGGEEFAVVLPGAGHDIGLQVAERARIAVAELFDQADAPIEHPVTVTIGVAFSPVDAIDVEVLLACADRRLYHGKRSGRNRVVTRDTVG